jgi:anti-anti-sigma factor
MTPSLEPAMTLTATPFDAEKDCGVHVSRELPRTLVSLSGEHDIATAQSVADALERASTLDRSDFVVDLSRVEFFDASIISVLVNFSRDLALQSRAIVLRDASPFGQRVLDLCGLFARPATGSSVDSFERGLPRFDEVVPQVGGV